MTLDSRCSVIADPLRRKTTAYVGWRVASGDPPSFISNYTIGTNAAWVMLGIMLWLATEWMRGFRG